MRWVVELPAPSGGIAATVTVDADSWAGALTHARGGSPIKKFRCEFDADNVVRVLDLSTREWYTIKPFRAVGADATSQRPAMPAATAPETPAPQGGTLPPPALAAAPAEPPAPVAVPVAPPAPEPAAVADSAPIVQSAAPTPEVAEPPAATVETPSVLVEEAPAAPSPEVAPVAVVAAVAAAEAAAVAPTAVSGQNTLFGVPPPRGDESRLVPIAEASGPFAAVEPSVVPTLLFERDQDPGTTNPLTYRERVFAVPAETTPQQAEQVARHAFAALRRALATRPRGRYVVVAVFDHHFTSRPSRPALVELRWKDWRGDVEVTFPPVPTAPVNGVEVAVQPPPAAIVTTPDGAALAHAPPVAEAPSADVSGSIDASAAIAVAAVAAPEVERVEAPVETSAAPVPPVSPTEVEAQAEESSTIVVSAAVEPPPTESPAPPVEAPAAVVVTPEPAVVVTPEPVVVVTPEPAVVAPEPAVVVAPEPAPAAVPEPAVVVAPETAAAPEPAVVAEPAPAAVPEAAVVVAPEPAASVVVEPAAPEAVAEPTIVVAPEPAAAAAEEQPAPAAEPISAPAPAAEPAPAPVAEAPRVDAKTRAALAKRLRGKDLLSELFDSLMVLSHMQNADEAADFIAKLLHDSIHADVSAVSLYDIDKDEFVVVASHGADGLLGRREKATRGAPGQMLRRRHGVMIARCEADDAIVANTAGGGALFAPAYHRDRLFAMVRLHREQGSVDFETDELDATTYVAGQLGEFLGTHSKRVGAAEFASDTRKPATTRRSIPPTKR